VTGAGGTSETYDLAIDPTRSTLDTAVRVAKLAEAARIDALFTADLLSFGAQGAIGSQEPLVFVSALSQVTSQIGLIATVSTTFHHPFNLARLFGTLDHVSNGRAAWNLVTSSIGEENFGVLPPSGRRPVRADQRPRFPADRPAPGPRGGAAGRRLRRHRGGRRTAGGGRTEPGRPGRRLLPDSGRDYLSKVFDDGWLRQLGLLDSDGSQHKGLD
jgi:hypothetical protein